MLVNGSWDAEASEIFSSFLSNQSPVVFLIMQEMKRGKSAAMAMDFVCGEGSYDKFAKEIWKSCRAR